MIVSCASCKRRHAVTALPDVCPACRAATLVEDPEATLPEVEAALAPGLDEAGVARVLEAWLAPVPCPATTASTLLATGARVWWPVWLADVAVAGSYSAQGGFEEEVESAVEELQRGQWRSRNVRRRQVRWAPRVGTIARRYDNLPVPALRAPDGLVGEAPRHGAPPEAGTILLPETEERPIDGAVRAAVAADVSRAMGAKEVRDLSLQLDPLAPTWTLGLVPMWIGADGDEPVVVNLVTGAVAGRRRADPAQARRRMLRGVAVGAALGGGALAIAAAGLLLPLLLPIAAVLGVVALVPPLQGIRLAAQVSAFNAEMRDTWSTRPPRTGPAQPR